MSGFVLACLGYFWFILPLSCLLQLVAIGYWLFHILYKKVKALKAREKWAHIRHVKRWVYVRHVIKWRHVKDVKKWRHERHVKKEDT